MQFVTQFNGKHVVDREKGGGASLTIPDQSMTIEQLIARFRAGMPLDGQRIALYEGEDEISIDQLNLDLIDREEAINQARLELEATKDRVRDAMKDRERRRVERIVEKRLAEKSKPKEDVADPGNE